MRVTPSAATRRRLLRLLAAQRGQARVGDPGVAARRAEVQVELALAVAQQDHGQADSRRGAIHHGAAALGILAPARSPGMREFGLQSEMLRRVAVAGGLEPLK
jgi:hypothetical protein